MIWVKKSNSRPDVVYGTSVNLSGLYASDPIKCTWDPGLESWWDNDGEFDIEELGLVYERGYVKFGAVDEEEVVAFIKGVTATMHLLSLWSTAHK